jgi:hypothetical protein
MGLMQRPRWPRTSRCWRQCWPTWLACGGSVDTAAKTLFCHPNTVRYRLNRVAIRRPGLNVPALRPVLLTLESEAVQTGPAGVLAILATWPRAQRRALASLICECAHGLLGGTATSLDPDGQSSLEWVITLAEQNPDDPLAVAPLLLRLHRLQPGQPIYLPNGVPHACLSGVGVEIMASRGQVYRASVGRALPASPQRHSPEPERLSSPAPGQ